MTTVAKSAHIPAAPDEVWAALADFAAISSWAPNVDHSCLLSEQSEGIGMARRVQTGRVTVVETVQAYEPTGTISYAISGLPSVVRSVTNTWTLEPSGAGTSATLTSRIDAGGRPPQRAIAKAVGRTLGRASEQMLEGLAAHFGEGNQS